MGAETLNPEDPENRTTQTQAPGRAERRLARSLEDVSYLFLSQTAAPGDAGGDRPGPASPRPAERPLRVASDASVAPQREALISLLQKNTEVLEEGLRAIDANIPLEIGGPIDLVAVDGSNQLVIIDLEPAGTENLLLRGICHFDWFVRNIPVLRRMYHGRVIDFSAQPRLFLVAPEISPLFKCTAQRIASPTITCFVYQAMTVPDGTGVFFKRVSLC